MKTYQIYSSYKNLPESWNYIVSHDVFLQRNYFEALEKGSPENIKFFFIGVFKNEQLVGGAVIQHVQLYLKDMFRKTSVSCFKTFFKDFVSRFLKGNVLVVGNLMQTGQHGMFYEKKKITEKEYLEFLFKGIDALKLEIKQTKKKTIRLVVMKDFFENDAIHNNSEFFLSKKLYNVFVQPNMILSLDPIWSKIDDYKASLTKKYRTRYKRAKKKLGSIKCEELSIHDIKKESKYLYQLYLNVSTNAKFNTFILPENHFYNLKNQLKDNFKVYGYYLEDNLIGFYTLILNGENLETYFLGYHKDHQYANQLYLNMLYDMLNFAIENRFKNIVYARTAMEIKSSVGAKPKPMIIYLKHTNNIINSILKQVFKLMNPSQDWEERHPFKT